MRFEWQSATIEMSKSYLRKVSARTGFVWTTIPFNGGVCSFEAASLARAQALLGICPALLVQAGGSKKRRKERGEQVLKGEKGKNWAVSSLSSSLVRYILSRLVSLFCWLRKVESKHRNLKRGETNGAINVKLIKLRWLYIIIKANRTLQRITLLWY